MNPSNSSTWNAENCLSVSATPVQTGKTNLLTRTINHQPTKLMNRKTILTILAMVAFALAQTPGQAQSDNDNKWSFDVSLNGLAAGLSGSTTCMASIFF